MKSLNQISFIDSSGNEIKLNANNTKEAAFDKVVGTVPLRDASGRFRIGNTGVSSTDGYVAVNKNYVDGRINALDKSDSAVAGQFVSAVSETNGIISVSRRAIVDSDGVVLKTGDQTITGTKTFKSVNFINFKDPEGRTNTALPNVCSMNMGDDTTLFDCDAAGKIGLIGRDDPIHPEQNPNHTTGIRFFRSSSNDTVPSDYADFFYDSSNDRFEASKPIKMPGGTIAQFSSLPIASGTAVLTYNAGSSGNKFGWSWGTQWADLSDVTNAQYAGLLAALGAIGGSLTACTTDPTTLTLGLKEALMVYEYTGYSNGSISFSGGSWQDSNFHYFSFPCVVIPYYSGSMMGSTRGFIVCDNNDAPAIYVASSSITITLQNASGSLYYKKFSLIP